MSRERTIEFVQKSIIDLGLDKYLCQKLDIDRNTFLETLKNFEKLNEDLKIEIVDYSEKACVLVGDTKKIKEQLINIGCKWNSNLKNCGPGWVFPKKNKDKILNLLKCNNIFIEGVENISDTLSENSIEQETFISYRALNERAEQIFLAIAKKIPCDENQDCFTFNQNCQKMIESYFKKYKGGEYELITVEKETDSICKEETLSETESL